MWKQDDFSELFSGHKSLISSVAFSPNGRMLASGSHDNTVRLWEVRVGELYLIGDVLQILARHTEAVAAVAFSPNSRIVASGSHDNTIRLWEVPTGETLKNAYRSYRNGLQCSVFI